MSLLYKESSNVYKNHEKKIYSLRTRHTRTKHNTQQQNKKTTALVKHVLNTVVGNEVEKKKKNQTTKVGTTQKKRS